MAKSFLPQSVWTHIFFICLFLVIPAVAFVRPPGEPFMALTRIFLQDTTANFVLLVFFYLNYYILLPKFFLQKRYIAYVALTILFLSLAFTLPLFVGKLAQEGHHHGPPDGFRPDGFRDGPRPPDSLAGFVFEEFRRHLALFFTAIFFSYLLRIREHLAEVKAEKLNAELNSLKAQINPHFLFNTLNSIYALAVKKDPGTSDAIIHLSGLMRYAVRDANSDEIPLGQEVEYISHYIELQKARLGNTASIQYNFSGDPGTKTIAPLILMTYIENAFTYGVNPNVSGCIVEIKLDITDDSVRLYTFNRKVELQDTSKGSGIGMNNTKSRLQHLYTKRHHLDIKDNTDSYSVNLNIQLL